MKAFIIVSLICVNLVCSASVEMDMELKTKESSHRIESFVKSRAVVVSNLTKLDDDVLTLNTCIGKPEQCFDLVFDTASFNLWVPSDNHTGCLECRSFNKTLSSTYREEIKESDMKLQYVTGDAFGKRAKDIVRVEEYGSEMTMDIMVADTIDFDVRGADGIIGFGRNYESNSNSELRVSKKNSMIESMLEKGYISERVFSQKYVDAEKKKAKLFIGETHEDFKNGKNVTSCNVFPADPLFARYNVKDMWACRLSHIIFGEPEVKHFDDNSYSVYSRAIIDSGTSYIMAPYKDIFTFRTYFKNIKGCGTDRDTFRGITVFYCDLDFKISALPKISFVLNGAAYLIPPEDLFKDYSYMGFQKKLFTIVFLDGLDYWSLGQVFMKNYHVLFDHKEDRVSFYAPDRKFVFDVSSKTSDEDFVMSDHIVFSVVVLFLLFVMISSSAFLLYMTRKRTGVKNEARIYSTYALMSRNSNNA